jgi:DNA-binding HxlR family transcriptional regulator
LESDPECKRKVNDGCQTKEIKGDPAADGLSTHSLHAVSERGTWTPNVIWYLREEPRRFSELMADIPGVSPKVFSARLKRLERDGILTRQVMPSSPPTVEYALTDLGHELTPAIEAIVQVGHKLKRRRAG